MTMPSMTSTTSDTRFSNLSEIFTNFDKQMDTYIKRTPRIPTAEEFLSDFENAFNTKLAELGTFGGLGSNEMEFARNILMPALFSEYQGRLGAIAKTGQSPFRTAPGGKSTSSSRTNSNSTGTSVENSSGASDTVGGSASSGPGGLQTGSTSGQQTRSGRDSTTTHESGTVSGNETIEEDILLPKVMPLDYLNEVLSPAVIKVNYEGSRRGAGQFQSSGTGATIARRV